MSKLASIADLQTALKTAKSGDTLVLANNTYVTDEKIKIACSGVIITAETLGKVIFKGGAVTFLVSGSNNTICGFQFVSGAFSTTRPADLFQISGSSNTIEQMNFSGYSAQHYVNIYNPSQHNTIQYCNFEAKPADMSVNGSQIEVQADAKVVGFHKISHCAFQNMCGNGGDYGNEPIRLGEGSMSTFNLSATVEYCVFSNTQLGDSEVVSVKSMYNIIRYNTVLNNQAAMVCLRNGNHNVVYGNFFLNSGGVRIKQASQISIYNNYFENSQLSFIMDDVSGYPNPTSYQNDIVLAYNTFNNCPGALTYSGITTQTGNALVNNIIYKTNLFPPTTTTAKVTITGNIYKNSTGFSYDSTNIAKDPLLTASSTLGYSIIDAKSPAVGAAIIPPTLTTVPNTDTDSAILLFKIGSQPNFELYDEDAFGVFIGLDISGVKRPTKKSLGSNEPVGGSLNKPLTVKNVGPSFLPLLI